VLDGRTRNSKKMLVGCKSASAASFAAGSRATASAKPTCQCSSSTVVTYAEARSGAYTYMVAADEAVQLELEGHDLEEETRALRKRTR
jgi:hypothetical protein